MLEYKGIREGYKLLFCDNGVQEGSHGPIEEKLSNYNRKIDLKFDKNQGLSILVIIDPLRAEGMPYINAEFGRFRDFYYHTLAKES
jgi:hypothetical protein